MKTMKRFAAVLLVTMLTAGVAQAGTLSLTGTVEAGVTVPVYAPIGGTVENVSIEQGMRVSAGDTLFSYRTEKVYASEDGVVKGVFVKAGDDAETMTEKYGADMYIEGETLYTISGSTNKAYSTVETTFVHTGETVYILCLDGKCKLLACRKLGEGSINAADISTRKIVETALHYNAASVVLAHNHPAGLCRPSEEDESTTLRIWHALDAVDIQLVDHIIVAGSDYWSMADAGFFESFLR